MFFRVISVIDRLPQALDRVTKSRSTEIDIGHGSECRLLALERRSDHRGTCQLIDVHADLDLTKLSRAPTAEIDRDCYWRANRTRLASSGELHWEIKMTVYCRLSS